MQGVILAAGKGTRLKPVTLTRTKAMAPILGKPIVERVIEDLADNGINDIIMVVSPDDDEIKRYFEEESALDITIKFVDQKTRKGMGDALRYAIPYIKDDFVLSACDNLVSGADIRKMIKLWKDSRNLDGLLVLMEIPDKDIPNSGIVEMDGEWVKRIVEKPSLEEAPSNTGSMPLYCFSNRILEYIPRIPISRRGEYELQDAIQMLIQDGNNIKGLQIESRLTLTSPADLLAINIEYMSETDHDTIIIDSPQIGRNTHLITPVVIDPGVVIGANCRIGPNAYIERDSRIGEGARIRDAIVLRKSNISDGTSIEGQVVYRD